MSAALLAKLKINKPPEIKQKFEINMPGVAQKEGVAVKTTIVDERDKEEFDRDLFLNTLKGRKIVNTLAAAAPLVPAALVPAAPLVPAPLVPGTKKITVRKPRFNIGVAKPTELSDIIEVASEAVASEAENVDVAKVGEDMSEAPAAASAVKPKKTITVRRTKKPAIGVKEGPFQGLVIGDADMNARLKKKKEAPVIIPASSYYMNNREIFINFMTAFFSKNKKKLAAEAAKPATCPGEGDVNEFSLMSHQEIVRDYLNVHTPYRGLLLYHGLGSGKTCSSIAIAEGMKSSKQIYVLTPAALQVNYREELKKCGDEMYRKNQFWEFISIKTAMPDPKLIDTLSNVLALPVEFIKKHGGAWLVNMSKPSNYNQLSADDKATLDEQIEKMIAHKYKFINYNGIRAKKMVELTQNNTVNPFDNAVVIIDEAHNLVSRIVNKLGKKTTSVSITLYELLLRAQNVKIVLLSGTPIINYPNEIGILFNMLRGYITSWTLTLEIQREGKIDTAYFQSLFKDSVITNKGMNWGNVVDLIEYKPSSTTLVITRNPFGFVNKIEKDKSYEGVKLELDEQGKITDGKFMELVTAILVKNNIRIKARAKVNQYKALPDTLDAFKNYFIQEDGKLQNMNLFKRRILGLTSYFRSAQESLMPQYEKENPLYFQVIKIPFSDFQFEIYEEARVEERDQEKRDRKKKLVKKATVNDLYEKTSSTYRIFSRVFCNFVFPRPEIRRPMPDKKNKVGEETDLANAADINEDDLDAVSRKERLNRDENFEDDEMLDDEDAEGLEGDRAAATVGEGAEGEGAELGEGAVATVRTMMYKDRIQNALKLLKAKSDKFLTPEALETYSPKFLNILENIQDETHVGIHLLYSQFRSLEGIGILKLILEANGFAQFKIKKIGETWDLTILPADAGKPMFALYTGTETPEEKEVLRNVVNSAWNYVPATIVGKLKKIAPNNNMGEIIKVFMITSSGAEGISLKNVRYVHITEPYWHPVRIEQVIGRARRICSHQALPVELRTVTVFLYLMTLSDAQRKDDKSLKLRQNDTSRLKEATPVTTDEALYEIASIKENIAANILTAVKEASIDCALHTTPSSKEKLQCFTFGSDDVNKITYTPSYEEDPKDAMAIINKTEQKIKLKLLEMPDDDGEMQKYAVNADTKEVYSHDSYLENRAKGSNLIKVGVLTILKKRGKEDIYKIDFDFKK